MEKSIKKAAALSYENKSDIPRLLAKGKGPIAEKILEIAKANGIAITEDKELVEILSALDLYQEIPQDLYRAVAEILSFIYELSKEPTSVNEATRTAPAE
ncbi:FlhB domain-containing protein [Candidatus Magnetoovum chiemensis]|nr:FlhB domain-containing protein [Candidatus Magnetoovum chiemensis]